MNEKPELIGPNDPRRAEFAGTITLSGLPANEAHPEVVGIDCRLTNVIATPRGIGFAMATMLTTFLECMPEDLRAQAFLQVIQGLNAAYKQSTEAKSAGEPSLSRPTIDAALLRRVLKAEKKKLEVLTDELWKSGRVALPAGVLARLARVMLLEDLLNGTVDLADEGQTGDGTPRGNDTLDL